MLHLRYTCIIKAITWYRTTSPTILSFRDVLGGYFTPGKMKELLENSLCALFKMMKSRILLLLNLIYPKSPIGRAIHCAYGIYHELIRYTKDGLYHIDNNQAENNVRDLALERKNYLSLWQSRSCRANDHLE